MESLTGTFPIAVLVTAAGSSERFGSGKKELLRIGGRSMLDLSLSPFLALPGLEALVITAPPGREAELRAALSPATLTELERLGPSSAGDRFAIVTGGKSRRDSVRLGLEELARIFDAAEAGGGREGGDNATALLDELVVLVHDGARPWSSPQLAGLVARAAAQRGAAVPVLPLVDTPKELGPGGIIVGHPARASLGAAQTPQGFRLGSLLAAHRRADAECLDCTDDAEIWGRFVGEVASVPGEAGNRKVTYARDLQPADSRAGGESRVEGDIRNSPIPREDGALSTTAFRVGQGWDLHRLVAGRRLMLGGVEVPSDLGEDAHSDGDVLLHAVIDALLGAAALGDIGTHFPPSDETWRGADSRDLARRSAAIVRDAGWEIGNLDCTVILESPRLGAYKAAIGESVASCLGVEPGVVSIKAKTMEGLGEVGAGRAVEAMAIASLVTVCACPRAERPGSAPSDALPR